MTARTADHVPHHRPWQRAAVHARGNAKRRRAFLRCLRTIRKHCVRECNIVLEEPRGGPLRVQEP